MKCIMKKGLSLLTVVLILTVSVISQTNNKFRNQTHKVPVNAELENATNIIDATTNSIVTYGNEAVFNYDHTWYLDVAVLDANHFVVVYGDWGNSRVGKAVIGTLSGSSITYGNTYLFNAGSTYKPRVASLDSTHFVISFGDSISPFTYNETLIAGSIAGNVITYGTPVIFNTPYGYFDSPVTELNETSFAVVYQDQNDSGNGKVIVGTLTGLNITLGTPCLFNIYSSPPPGTYYGRKSITTLDSSSIVIAYHITNDSVRAVATVGSVSGTTVTFGSEYIFNTGSTEKLSITALESDRFVIAYVDKDINHFQYGTALVGNVTGDSISYSQEYDFYGPTMYVSASALDPYHFVVLYFNNENVHSGASKIGTVVENTIYYDDEITYNPAYSFWQTVDCFNENRYVIAYGDETNGGHPHKGTSIIGIISQYPVITKINADTICSENTIRPIITQYIEDVIEFSLTLYYDTLFQNYLGYQNTNSLLDSGTISVVDSSGQIDITWNSTSSVYITSDTLIELLFGNVTTYNQYTSGFVWDTNSYYKDSQGVFLETIFHDGHVVINPIPVDADTISGNSFVCQGTIDESYQVSQITNATSYIWELIPDSAGNINGTDTIITISFSPSYIGLATLSVYGSNLCGDGTSSSLIIDVIENPIVNAGYDDEICEYESYLLSGEASNYSSVNWTTSGDGSFDDPALLTATYYPGANDISNGTVNLTLTATPNYPCVESIDDQVKIDIISLPEQPQSIEGPITIDLDITQTSEYTTSQVSDITSYEWFLDPTDAGVIEGNDTIGTVNWNPSYVGLYAYVYVNAINDCGATNSDSLGISVSPVGVYSSSYSDIVIYPNPAKTKLYIKNVEEIGLLDVNIFNLMGQNIISNRQFINHIDISILEQGIYVIEIATNKNKIRQKLIIKR